MSAQTVGTDAGDTSAVTDHALVVGPAIEHGPDSELVKRARLFDIPVERISKFGLAHLRGPITMTQVVDLADRFLADPVKQWWLPVIDHHIEGTLIETGLRPGVTDREGAELMRGAAEAGTTLTAATLGSRWVIEGPLKEQELRDLAHRILHNEVIERWALGTLPAAFTDAEHAAPPVQTIAIRGTDEAALAEINRRRRLGLDPEEMVVIRDHYTSLDRDPTDAELETLAQTWSEHCAHKTFRAHITVTEPDGSTTEVDSMMKSYLRAATDTVNAPWVRSAFVDNAGIVAFDDHFDLALKAETHNHPSALEPFGGANTGVGGVVRDILGVSAKPIAVTDILCFGPEDTDPDDVPDGVLHPQRIREGVIAGVGDYGNKIGVPNIGGAIVHDERYTTTPLVFAGCIGLLPTGSNPTQASAGDSIVVLGGAVGRDGVGGATFSSQTMGAETAEVAGSSVQIGDPIVEKGLIDVVLAARDAQLYTAITDCGAGGLSSAVGEMAEELGANVDLATVPRKYPGLAAWEVWLSEAQERMVLAVPDPAPLLALADRWSVGSSVIGTFTGDGRLHVHDGGETVIDIACEFLHDGRPQRRMTALAPVVQRPPRTDPTDFQPAAALLALLAHPSIRSNEAVIRTYDHEIMGGTLVRPYGGAEGDGPADGTVQIPPGTQDPTSSGTTAAMAIGIGVNAVIGAHDAEAMAWHVIDEAVRNAVIGGADPARLSLLDNFAWGNPTDPQTLGEVVAACRGCHDAALAFGAPFVSGKDSLYNVFVGPDGQPDPVAPTLVITAVGVVADATKIPLTGVVEPGSDIWLVGPADGALGGSHLDEVLGSDAGGELPAIDRDAVGRHGQVANAIAAGLVRSAHDLSEGGLAVAAAEWAFAGRVGLELNTDGTPEALFGEGAGRYLVEVDPADADAFSQLVGTAERIGESTDQDVVRVGPVLVTMTEIQAAYVDGLTGEVAGDGREK